MSADHHQQCEDMPRTNNISSKDHGWNASLSFYCGRRAMVKKIWCRELTGKFFQLRVEPIQPRHFTQPRCQDTLRPWYVVYRWSIFTCWLLIILCSVFEIGSVQPLGKTDKWPIYLTNWDLVLGLIQSLLGCILVTRRWKLQSQPTFEPSSMVYGKLEKVFWYLYTVTTSLALGVTITYWSLVHDPAIHHADTLNFLIHVVNSVLMLLDFFVSSVPFEVRCFWWCPLFICSYLLFSIIYYLAGGLDKNGLHRIYNILDWEKPITTFLICTGGLIFMIIMHCLLCLLARFRDNVYERNRKSSDSDSKDEKNNSTYKNKNESYV